MKTLGQFIREKRSARELSLRELARRVVISAAFLSEIELGRRYPSAEVLKKLSQELKISVKELQNYDARVFVAELKRLAAKNPRYGLAFRKIAANKVPPEELIKLAESFSKTKTTG